MCGIAGLINYSGSQPEDTVLRRMLTLISHRGPDAYGLYRDGRAGLAHARLSIIDLSGGDQPVHNEDQSLWVVYNGEIFNYVELRQELEDRGHRFYTKSDTEILVHLYEDEGVELLDVLNGQFAFALWDRRKEQLLLARDRVGIRPLFYHLEGAQLTFGSEVKALFGNPRISRALSPLAISDVFTCWAPLGSLTAFENVYQLPPGHYGLFAAGELTIRPYWQLSFQPSSGEDRPLEEWTAELQALLQDATRIRLRADVPVGAYLSGGLDSTYITALVKKSFNNELRTFSVSFTDGRFDEAPFQEKAVEALGTEHRSIRCTERDIGECFPQVIWHTETPMLRTAPAPLFRLSQLVRENDFKVVLTGEGSDEIFAGYDIFKEDRVRRFWARQPASQMRPRLLQRLYPDIFGSEDNRNRAFLEGFFRKNLTNVESPVYSHLTRWENTSKIKAFFSQHMLRTIQKETGFSERLNALFPRDFMTWDPLSRAQFIEISVFLSNYLLSSQGDRVAMAHAIEGRFPFLDYRVVQFACSMPPRFRLHGLRDKFILRQAATALIPPELSQRPKQPYRAPISRCFLGTQAHEYATDMLSEQAIRRTGYFDPARVPRLVSKCLKQDGFLLSERENMALVGILSTQLLDHLFIENFPAYPVRDLNNVKVFGQEVN